MSAGGSRAHNLDKDPRIVNVWEDNLEEEVGHLAKLIETYNVIAIVSWRAHPGHLISRHTLQAAGRGPANPSKTATSTAASRKTWMTSP